jgi:hypothetical protein
MKSNFHRQTQNHTADNTPITHAETYEIRPEALELLDYWRHWRGDFVLPTRRALDPLRLRRWINNLSVVEYRADEKRFFVRLHSQFTQENLGQNMSRRYFDDTLSPTALSVVLLPYEAAMRARKPTLSVIMPQLYPNLFKRLDRFILPFTNELAPEPDAQVDRFVTWVGPAKDQSIEAIMRDTKAPKDTLDLKVIEV